MTITSAGSSTSLAQLRQLQQSAFKTADADGDGQLSLTEFQSIGQNVQGAEGQQGPPPMRGGGGPGEHFKGDTLSSLLSTQSVDDLTSSLRKAGDADGDGKMSASELSSALAANAPEGAKGQGIEDRMASDIMSALDTDGDGSLSSSEISSAITTAAANESSAQATRGPPPSGGASGASGSSGVFESLDTNQDGTVSAEELAAANSSDGTSGTSAASDLIKTADQDGDGTLSGGEFAALLEQGKSTGTDASSTLSSLMSGSTVAADLMQKLLAQLDKAMTTSTSTAASGGTNVTA
jgi:Ca2+-binding EF-hand superfamily protein